MALSRGKGYARIGGIFALGAFLAAAGHAATPLDFPSPQEIESGHTYAWRIGSSFLMDDPTVGPFALTYAIDDAFMMDQTNLTADEARDIVTNAFEAWTLASHGHLMFAEAPWSAVMNIGGAPPDQWEGPSLDEWLSGEFEGVYPGWGANIECFSVPTGFTLNSQGVQYVMFPTSLAFTVVNRVGSTHITSVDIYFNSSFDWFNAHEGDGADAGDATESPMYDVATVLLHELGHAFGLDHPNESVSNGSANLSPYTFNGGYPWSMEEIMYGFYQGVREHPTIDEVGGIAFLYGLPSPLDLNGDHEVGGGDLAMLLANWGGSEMGLPGDLNYDGVIDAADLGILLSNFNAQLGPADGDAATSASPEQPDLSSMEPLHPIVRDCYHVPLNGAGTPE